MFSSLSTKLVLKKAGLSSDTFNFTSPPTASRHDPAPPADDGSPWPAWMSVRALPITVQPWLAPPQPPIPVAELPKVGELAPLDRDRKIVCGRGGPVLVVFLRCVGCAFAQKTFHALRALSVRHEELTCLAISHSSPAATKKWLDLIGGAWNVSVIHDEDLSLYATWGLGPSTLWSVLNPTTQIQGWKEKGWLGNKVAESIQRKGLAGGGVDDGAGRTGTTDSEGSGLVMGNKWQSAGAWAVDAQGVVVWGGKAARADDVMDLDEGIRALGLTRGSEIR
ncbi:hypothetical protein VUR80DRAFT_1113 [Thermomyces stellatus]